MVIFKEDIKRFFLEQLYRRNWRIDKTKNILNIEQRKKLSNHLHGITLLVYCTNLFLFFKLHLKGHAINEYVSKH